VQDFTLRKPSYSFCRLLRQAGTQLLSNWFGKDRFEPRKNKVFRFRKREKPAPAPLYRNYAGAFLPEKNPLRKSRNPRNRQPRASPDNKRQNGSVTPPF
jgi:hypothetical protein